MTGSAELVVSQSDGGGGPGDKGLWRLRLVGEEGWKATGSGAFEVERVVGAGRSNWRALRRSR